MFIEAAMNSKMYYFFYCFSESDLLCQEPGLFAHPTDCGRFLSCRLEEGRLQQIILSCGEGEGFDESMKQCIARKYVSVYINFLLCNFESRTIRTATGRIEKYSVPWGQC